MRSWCEQALFTLTCLVAALFVGGSWGGFIYLFNRPAGWSVGLSSAGFTFFMLLTRGWSPAKQLEEKHSRRHDD